MNGVISCSFRPTHPSIKCMKLERSLPEGKSLSGCVCGMIFHDAGGDRLAVEGRTAPVCRLTAMCWQPEDVLAGDRLRCGGEVFVVRSVSTCAGILSAIIETSAGAGDGGV